jgi:chromosome segregation ATPase
MDITLEQLQTRIDELESRLSEISLNNEVDHGNIIEQIESQTSSSISPEKIKDITDNITVIKKDINSLKSTTNNISINTNLIDEVKNELESIKSDLGKNNLDDINSRLSNVELKINNISKVYITKIDHQKDIDIINAKFTDKVNYTDLEQYDERLTELEEKSEMATVADQMIKIRDNVAIINNSINVINTSLEVCKNTDESLNKRISALSNSIQYEVGVLNNRCDDIENDLRDKNNKISNINTKLAEANCAINNIRLKCASLLSKIDEVQTIINNKIDNLEDSMDKKITSAKLSMSNDCAAAIKDHNRYLQGHSREFSEIRTRLDKIDGKNGVIKDIQKTLEKKWITVLSPEEYRRIPSSNIKQDQLYMCIKYGKPYALYIGSVLIAQRNSTKESGFIYTFPLSF